MTDRRQRELARLAAQGDTDAQALELAARLRAGTVGRVLPCRSCRPHGERHVDIPSDWSMSWRDIICEAEACLPGHGKEVVMLMTAPWLLVRRTLYTGTCERCGTRYSGDPACAGCRGTGYASPEDHVALAAFCGYEPAKRLVGCTGCPSRGGLPPRPCVAPWAMALAPPGSPRRCPERMSPSTWWSELRRRWPVDVLIPVVDDGEAMSALLALLESGPRADSLRAETEQELVRLVLALR